ncbi:MAG: maleylpyruvate isomerase N-terminal domain-containing protein [Acidimicrobiales bacterium]
MALVRDRLAALGRQSAEMFRSLDMNRAVQNSEWTVADTAAHLIYALRGFTDSAAGHYEEWEQWAPQIPKLRTTERVAAMNRVLIPAEPHRSAIQAAQAISDGVRRWLDVTATLAPDQRMPTPWYGETESLSIAEATRLLLGEQVIHGYDVAKTVGHKWPITKQDALLICEVGRTMMPKVADPAVIGTTQANYMLHLGDGGKWVVRLANGRVTVEPPAGQKVQCHILADPVGFVLVAYGRVSQWTAISKGQLFTFGTKPWMAFKFKSFFSNP